VTIKAIKRVLFGPKDKIENVSARRSESSHSSKHDSSGVKSKDASHWEDVLTQSLQENSLAPADEIILHAFDLYQDELNAPFVERRRLMNERFSKVAAGFAQIQSLAPDMVERAAAKHRFELDRFIDKKGGS